MIRVTKDMFNNDEGNHTNYFEVIHGPEYTSDQIIEYILECQNKAENWDKLSQATERYRDIIEDD